MLFESSPIYFSVHRQLFLASHQESHRVFRFGQPSVAVRLLAGGAARVRTGAATVERWARGGNDSAPLPPTLARMAGR